MHEWVCYHDEAANHQLPTAVAFWIIQIVSTQECSSLMQNLMQIRCSTYSVTLNAMATQCTCSLNSIYHPHWRVQWSHRCSRVCIPVHCPWLPGCIDVLWLLAFPKTNITFEREEILDHPWNSGKCDRAADGDWENCVRSQGAYFEGDWGVIVLCSVFCIFFNKCLHFS